MMKIASYFCGANENLASIERESSSHWREEKQLANKTQERGRRVEKKSCRLFSLVVVTQSLSNQ